jgi:hypothetical protein
MKMKRNIILLLLILLGIGLYFYLDKNEKNLDAVPEKKELPKKIKTDAVLKTDKPIVEKKLKEKPVVSNNINKKTPKIDRQIAGKPSFRLNRLHTWSMLRIKPMPVPEGIHYTFSGFDVIDNSTACIVGRFNNHNLLKIIKDDVVSEVALPAIPLDVKAYQNKIYVLTQKGLSIVHNNKVISNIAINDPKLPFYDKLIVFDQKLFLLMSDGSAYELQKNALIKHKALMGKTNQEIWIQKTGRNAFALKASPCQNICQNAKYNSEIGSITLSGGTTNRIFVCIDKYNNTKPIKINRIISSSHSQFKKELLTLPADTYTYIKNDYKIHNNHIYYVKVDEKGFRIINKQL